MYLKTDRYGSLWISNSSIRSKYQIHTYKLDNVAACLFTVYRFKRSQQMVRVDDIRKLVGHIKGVPFYKMGGRACI